MRELIRRDKKQKHGPFNMRASAGVSTPSVTTMQVPGLGGMGTFLNVRLQQTIIILRKHSANLTMETVQTDHFRNRPDWGQLQT